MKAPVWVPLSAVTAIHAELIAEHGGLSGPARCADLEAALKRPEQLLHYAKPPPTVERLAAAYGYSLARSHCFPDGNKRIALAVMDVFLQLNGRELRADEADAVNTLQQLAAGEMSEEQLSEWISAPTTRYRRAR